MEATTTTVNLKQEALKNGAIWGVINIVLFLAVWYIAPRLMSSFWYTSLNAIIGILLAVFFCLDLRKKVGYWSFSQALWPIVGMFLMNMTIYLLFTSVLFGKVIDKNYPVKMKEYAVESLVKMNEAIGGDDASLEKMMEGADERFEKQFNPGFKEFIFQYGLSALFYFIGALIFALIFKKNNPNPWSAQHDEPVQED